MVVGWSSTGQGEGHGQTIRAVGTTVERLSGSLDDRLVEIGGGGEAGRLHGGEAKRSTQCRDGRVGSASQPGLVATPGNGSGSDFHPAQPSLSSS